MKAPATIAKAPRSLRKRKEIEAAIQYRIREGETWDEAARRAGLTPAGLWKARLREDVQALIEKEQIRFVAEVAASKAAYQALAWETGAELMRTSKSEAIRARMVEFLAGGGKAAGAPAVQINQTFGGSGYAFVPPGASVVDITPAGGDDPGAGDSTSHGNQSQTPDN